MAKHIVYTRHDGGVDICTPTAEIYQIMRDGGYWAGLPPLFLMHQAFLQIQDGIKPEHAIRFVKAVAYGGCDEAEVLDIIKDRDCARHGTGHTILETEDIPEDRWFRDAWRLGHNSGQIHTDLELAKPLQWRYVSRAVSQENKRRAEELKRIPPLEPDLEAARSAVLEARDEDELRKVWPL